ncbi:MAG: OB-fold domain-containing protein [Actinomycetota bacterium]|nr:OB-fold domain-containing protein [Actinomycetota bacterium]
MSIPIVDYLVLEPKPHLVAQECTACKAKVFGRHNACPACFNESFAEYEVPTTGILKTFTIVQFAAKGIQVPYTTGIVNCGGMDVATNITGVEALPENITRGMEVQLTTFPLGTDAGGVEAIGFGFEPV